MPKKTSPVPITTLSVTMFPILPKFSSVSVSYRGHCRWAAPAAHCRESDPPRCWWSRQNPDGRRYRTSDRGTTRTRCPRSGSSGPHSWGRGSLQDTHICGRREGCQTDSQSWAGVAFKTLTSVGGGSSVSQAISVGAGVTFRTFTLKKERMSLEVT